MDFPKNLSEALCRIHAELDRDILQNPDKLSPVFLDVAPNLKAERNQVELLIKSGCLKKLAGAYNLSPAESKAAVATAVDILADTYLMDRGKAEVLCSTYVAALGGREYKDIPAQPVVQGQGRMAEQAFSLRIEDAFAVAGRGVVVTGYVSGSTVHTGDAVVLVKKNGQRIAATVSGIESYKKIINEANPGQAVGILLPGLKVADVERGDTLAARNWVKPENASAFQLVVDNAFDILGRGAVVTGYVQGESVCLGEPVVLVKKNGVKIAASVAGIEMHHTLFDRADPGDAVGLLLPELMSKHIEVGDKLLKR